MIRRPPRSTLSSSSAASDVYKRQQMERMEKGDSEASLVHQVRMDPMVPTETQDSLVRKENKENLVRQEVQVQWALQEQMVPPEQTDRT